jgi:hypothetical protein
MNSSINKQSNNILTYGKAKKYLSILSVPDEDYFSNVLCAVNLMSTGFFYSETRNLIEAKLNMNNCKMQF